MKKAETFDTKVTKAKIVALNKEIAKYAKEKNLFRAQECFNMAESTGAANSHTYAAIINAYVRCGYIDQAYRVYESLKSNSLRIPLDVISCTTMMKGFCGAGDIQAARQIFDDMIQSRPKVKPNIRTINTFLRGCVLTGSLPLAEEIFPRINHEFQLTPDISSWEYLVTLLAQALVIDKILPIIGRLRSDNTLSGGVASMCVNLSRAAALLTEFKLCRKYLSLAAQLLENEENLQQSNCLEFVPSQDQANQKESTGGKQAWKQNDPDDARAQSLELYQEHRRAELRQEILSISDFMHLEGVTIERNISYFRRVLLFNHVNVKNTFQGEGKKDLVVDQLFAALVFSLGLDRALGMRHPTKPINSVEFQIYRNREPNGDEFIDSEPKKKKKSLRQKRSPTIRVVSGQVAEGFIEIREHLDRCFTSSNHLEFGHLFSDSNQQLPLKLEICSGFGEWVVKQAKADIGRANWIALELKQDRVYHIFTRSIFEGATNISTICGDALRVLPSYFPESTLTSVFVNYPEPPQQIGGDDTQSRHLLTHDFFAMIDRVLINDGTITILTDNLWYGRLLLKIVASNSHERHFVNVNTQSDVQESLRGFILYNGKPGADCGHDVEASSYFDRLWQRGRQPERYYLVLRKTANLVTTLKFGRATKRSASQTQITKIGKKIKFSEDSDSP